MTKEEVEKLAHAEEQIRSQAPCIVEFKGKRYKVRQVSGRIREKVTAQSLKVYALNKKCEEPISLKERLKINKQVGRAYYMTSALYRLGNWSIIPLLARFIAWRTSFKTHEFMVAINSAGLNNKDNGFFSINSQLLKNPLDLTTMSIWKAIEESQGRAVSSQQMLEDDLNPKQGSK